MGDGRRIYGDARIKGLKVHRSVKTRLEVLDKAGKQAYTPNAYFKIGQRDNKKFIESEEWNIDDPNAQTHWEWVD